MYVITMVCFSGKCYKVLRVLILMEGVQWIWLAKGRDYGGSSCVPFVKR